MTNDPRSPSEIERDIERDRANLASTINEIQSRFTPEALVNEITQTVRTHGGDIGQAVARSVKQNPIGLALTGVGLAWMIFGRSYDDRALIPKARSHSSDDDAPRANLGRRVDTAPAKTKPVDTRRGPVPAYDPARHPDWIMADDDDDDYGDDTGSGGGMKDRVKASGAAIQSSASNAGSRVSDAAHGVADRAKGAGQSVSDAARSGAERAARARERLARGTEDMSEAARERVIAARRRAVAARRKAAKKASRGWSQGRESAVDFIEEQPLIAGALALAIGAAIAAALPRTQREDEMFGSYSDDLLDEAERIYLEEREKVEKVAVATLDETRDVLKEKAGKSDAAGQDAVKQVRSEAADAADRITSKAKEEAEKQNLGNRGK